MRGHYYIRGVTMGDITTLEVLIQGALRHYRDVATRGQYFIRGVTTGGIL